MDAVTDGLIDRVYEAAIVPELWGETCDLISAEIGGFSTALITVAPQGALRWVCSPCITEQMAMYQASGLAERTERPRRGLELAPGSFMRDIDLQTMEELQNEPLYTELLQPIGLSWEMGAVFLEPSGAMLIFSMLARTEDGPFDETAVRRINTVKADLARAAFMSTRLAFREAQTMAQSLSIVGLPAAVIGDRGNVVAMNDRMEALAPRVMTTASDRMRLADAEANALLSSILETLRLDKAPKVQSIPIAAQIDAPALVLHVVPVKRNARDIFTRSYALVVITPVGQVGPPDLKVICGLFDLTRVEARVAQELTKGRTVEEVALSLGVGRETVRSHLKSIFAKTGVSRQQQLVLLLSGLGQSLAG